MITSLAVGLILSQGAKKDPLYPYSFEAKGAQVRMYAINKALDNLAAGRQSTGVFVVESSLSNTTVKVRVRDSQENQLFEFDPRSLKDVDYKPVNRINNMYQAASSAFHTVALTRLSDADPVWSTLRFEITRDEKIKMWKVKIKSTDKNLWFPLNALVYRDDYGEGAVYLSH